MEKRLHPVWRIRDYGSGIDLCTFKKRYTCAGDIDGVLVVPRVMAYDVLVRAEETRENEKKTFGWVKGNSFRKSQKRGSYF